MTPERLRQIAERLETQCAELRMHVEESEDLRIACDGCMADARALRDYADYTEKTNVKLQNAIAALGLEPWNPLAKPN